ncbi:hypothetical protein NKJ51_28655 [Mesorhizobium sp. M0134]|uniref:hypothetical protein n=1 Tax=Mesorhizobium sp. M0134 TaxID=2956889 RepID=UPI00333C1BF1
MTAPIPLDEMSEKALARVAVPHMSRYAQIMLSDYLMKIELRRQPPGSRERTSAGSVATICTEFRTVRWREG